MWTYLGLAYLAGGLLSCLFGPAAKIARSEKRDFSGPAWQQLVFYLAIYAFLIVFWPVILLAQLRPAPRTRSQDMAELLAALDQMNAAEWEVDGDEFPNGTGDFGYTAENPIPCQSFPAAYAYLRRLRTVAGDPLSFTRIGSTSSRISKKPIDIFAVQAAGDAEVTLFVSPYQKRTSSRAPSGFVLA